MKFEKCKVTIDFDPSRPSPLKIESDAKFEPTVIAIVEALGSLPHIAEQKDNKNSATVLREIIKLLEAKFADSSYKVSNPDES